MTPLFNLVKIFFGCSSLPVFYFVPFLQIFFSLFLGVAFTSFLIFVRPWKSDTTNIKRIIQESILSLIQICVMVIFIDQSDGEPNYDFRENIGRGIIFLAIVLLMTELGSLAADLFEFVRDLLRSFKRGNKVEGNPHTRRIKRLKKEEQKIGFPLQKMKTRMIKRNRLTQNQG